MQTYCPHCSKVNEFSLSKPNFCGYCKGDLNDLGVSIAKTTISSYTNKSKISLNRHISAEGEIDENTEIPNIEKLEIEPIQPENKGIKLGVVAKQGKTGFKREKGQKMSIKQAEEIFRKEAVGKAKPIEIDGSEEE